MKTEDFNYRLPKEFIAQEAAHPHDHCRLMVIKNKIEHQKFYNIIDYLKKGDVLVVNQTKVLHAKLLGKKQTGARLEAILTKPLGNNTWQCRIKSKNIKVGTTLIFNSTTATVTTIEEDIFTILFEKEPAQEDIIIPTPPYITKKVPEKDYQTVFAKTPGSLAAPTAGLHFTADLIKKLKEKGVKFATITLHIGSGAFLPVRDRTTYKTEPEYFEIDEENAAMINSATRIIPVGTTSIKALESAANAAKNGKVKAASGFSTIFIKPGYQFNLNFPAIITNFHLPQSSLLMLVCAYGGTERILTAYKEAVNNNYRFYSLGDAMIVFKEEQ